MDIETFVTLASLVGLLALQIKLIQALVALVKDGYEVEGKALITWSIGIGFAVGALVFGMAYEALIAQYQIYTQVIIGVFFLLISGVAASGFYDLNRS